MLAKNPDERPSFKEIIEHDFFYLSLKEEERYNQKRMTYGAKAL